ncbi:hypothetical protein RHOER0001_1212 [Rhodococcus erythropolis SK121]|nr:hypothetical protein RHOER0001_1212 [Rhodococcus erythropolis SK121]
MSHFRNLSERQGVDIRQVRLAAYWDRALAIPAFMKPTVTSFLQFTVRR